MPPLPHTGECEFFYPIEFSTFSLTLYAHFAHYVRSALKERGEVLSLTFR